jgi:hypothetical protein
MAQTFEAQDIIAACTASWNDNLHNCSAFVRAVAFKLGIQLPNDANADSLISSNFSMSPWISIPTISTNQCLMPSGIFAKMKAASGAFVVAGLKSSEQLRKTTEGHVAVVIDKPLDKGLYPYCWCGSSGSTNAGRSEGDKSIGLVFYPEDRDRVHYWYWSGIGK